MWGCVPISMASGVMVFKDVYYLLTRIYGYARGFQSGGLSPSLGFPMGTSAVNTLLLAH